MLAAADLPDGATLDGLLADIAALEACCAQRYFVERYVETRRIPGASRGHERPHSQRSCGNSCNGKRRHLPCDQISISGPLTGAVSQAPLAPEAAR